MKTLRLALGFLTILPVRVNDPLQPGDLGRSAAWFSAIGLCIGAILAAAHWLFNRFFPPLVGAALLVVLWAVLTGGLHLDGLADCCDGLLASTTPERRLEILKDSRIGSFGASGLILHLLLKFACLCVLPSALPLLLAPSVGRWLNLIVARQPPARPGGMGADFALGLTLRHLLLGSFVPLLLVVIGGWQAALAVACAVLAAVGIILLARARLGGVTGDVLGLTIELGELAVLLVYSVRI